MHSPVLVITPQRPDEGQLEELLWPWCDDNPDSIRPRWDYFELGGMFQGFFDPDWMPRPGDRPWDVAVEHAQRQKRHLDIAALRGRAAALAADAHDRARAASGGRPLPDLAQLKRDHGEEGWRTHWFSDPVVRAMQAATGALSPETMLGYAGPREADIAKARHRALLTSAIVAGGRWHGPESADWEDDPARAVAWAALSERLIAAADPDDWLTIVDCHS